MTLGAPVLEHTSADVTHLDQEIAALEDDVNEEMRNKRRSMQFSDLQRLARLQEDSKCAAHVLLLLLVAMAIAAAAV